MTIEEPADISTADNSLAADATERHDKTDTRSHWERDSRRRTFLVGLATAGTVSVAGCLGVFEIPEENRYAGISDENPQSSDGTQQAEPTDAVGESNDGKTGTETKNESDGDDPVRETEGEIPTGEESATESREGNETGTDAETFAIEWVNEGGATIEVAANEALLDRALDEGFEPPWQCGRGICGYCTSKVDGNGSEFVEHGRGEYDNQYLDDDQIEAGYVLTCVGYPNQDFVIETGMKDEADGL